jgi:hypothetical protein
LGSIKRWEILKWLCHWQLLRKGSAPWEYSSAENFKYGHQLLSQIITEKEKITRRVLSSGM